MSNISTPDVSPPVKKNTVVKVRKVKHSSTSQFLKDLYTYPPKFRIKSKNALRPTDPTDNWPHIYRFKKFRLRKLRRDQFYDFLTRRDIKQILQDIPYYGRHFIKGYRTRRFTDRFYKEETIPIREALSKVPVYVVMNGRDRIVLARAKKDPLIPRSNPVINQLYRSCGAFNDVVGQQRNVGLGLFFLSRTDAEAYMYDIMRQDEGVATYGVALHCIGMDSAYEIMRQHHPTVDFRFIPDLGDLCTFMEKKMENRLLIFDREQQQVRWKFGIHKPLKYLLMDYWIYTTFYRLWMVPFFSFMKNDGYFKGVPVYLVQVNPGPSESKWTKEKYKESLDEAFSYFNKEHRTVLAHVADETVGRAIKIISHMGGFRENLLMRGRIESASKESHVINYAFFSVDQAQSFVKEWEFKKREHKEIYKPADRFFDDSSGVIPYAGSRGNMPYGQLVRRPKIYVTNLEDFLERWEESIIWKKYGWKPQILDPYNDREHKDRTIFDTRETVFVPKLQPASNFKPYLEDASRSACFKRYIGRRVKEAHNDLLHYLRPTLPKPEREVKKIHQDMHYGVSIHPYKQNLKSDRKVKFKRGYREGEFKRNRKLNIDRSYFEFPWEQRLNRETTESLRKRAIYHRRRLPRKIVPRYVKTTATGVATLGYPAWLGGRVNRHVVSTPHIGKYYNFGRSSSMRIPKYRQAGVSKDGHPGVPRKESLPPVRSYEEIVKDSYDMLFRLADE